jgi:hypothetical protein
MEPCWIPRDLNQQADKLSRIQDRDDWSIDQKSFDYLDCVWGPHSIDRFASSTNARLVRYNTRYAHVGSEAVDAFTQNWAGDNNWICPPVSQILKCIQVCMQQRAQGTLVVPRWPSAVFYPSLLEGQFSNFIEDCFEFYSSFTIGKSMSPEVFNDLPAFNMLAVKIRFT